MSFSFFAFLLYIWTLDESFRTFITFQLLVRYNIICKNPMDSTIIVIIFGGIRQMF
jgi:hypothetical protein